MQVSVGKERQNNKLAGPWVQVGPIDLAFGLKIRPTSSSHPGQGEATFVGPSCTSPRFETPTPPTPPQGHGPRAGVQHRGGGGAGVATGAFGFRNGELLSVPRETEEPFVTQGGSLCHFFSGDYCFFLGDTRTGNSKRVGFGKRSLRKGLLGLAEVSRPEIIKLLYLAQYMFYHGLLDVLQPGCLASPSTVDAQNMAKPTKHHVPVFFPLQYFKGINHAFLSLPIPSYPSPSASPAQAASWGSYSSASAPGWMAARSRRETDKRAPSSGLRTSRKQDMRGSHKPTHRRTKKPRNQETKQCAWLSTRKLVWLVCWFVLFLVS